MESSATLPELESALSCLGRMLQFGGRLETSYEEQRAPSATKAIRSFLLVYLAINLFCFLCDVQAGTYVLRWALLLRLGLFLPVTGLAWLLLQQNSRPWVKGVAAVTPMVVDTAIVVLLARLSAQPYTDRYLMGALIGVFAQTLVAPVPLRYAAGGLFTATALYVSLCLLPLAGHLSPPVSQDLPIFMCGLGVSGLYQRYRSEKADRRDFLLSEINRLRTDELLRMNSHLERLSSLDSLTGVFNRRYLDTALRRLWDLTHHHERWISVLMIDIDHFKSLNDHAGHQYGDYCLEHVAQALQTSVRAGIDTVARYGGEEFVAILPDADELEAVAIGERVRTSIEDLSMPATEGLVVTVSIGAATVQGCHRAVSLESFMAAADQALYAAKKSGRNRLISHADDAAFSHSANKQLGDAEV